MLCRSRASGWMLSLRSLKFALGRTSGSVSVKLVQRVLARFKASLESALDGERNAARLIAIRVLHGLLENVAKHFIQIFLADAGIWRFGHFITS